MIFIYTVVTFSPTGNSRYVANKIIKTLDLPATPVLELEKIKKLPDNQHLILVSTIRAFEFPKVVIDFVKNIPNQHFKYASIIGVGCNDEWINSAASLYTKEILISKNIEIIVDTTVAMPLNLIKSFSFDMTQNLILQFDKQVVTISNNIKSLNSSNKVVPFKAKCISKIHFIEHNASKLFGLELYANKNCIHCGKCVRDCPTKNISFKENKKLKFEFKCMLCLRCVYECPQKAINPMFSKFVLIKGGYIPPLIKD